MADTMFDVYLIGATDPSPSAQMRLAASIAARYRLSALAVAQALEGTPCLVLAGLPHRQATALVDTLNAIGAKARCSPRPTATIPAGSAPAASAAPAAHTRLSDAQVPAAALEDRRITLKSGDVDLPAVVDVAESIEFADPRPEAQTSVRGPDTLRCPSHGLIYNRRQASGCVKCLESARARARALREQAPFARPTAQSIRDNPVKRAFWGLAVALFAGFVPAAIYARGPNRAELLGLRAVQTEISSQPATRESLARFDELDAAVDAAHQRGAGRTLVIWLAGAAIAGALWSRATRPAGSDA